MFTSVTKKYHARVRGVFIADDGSRAPEHLQSGDMSTISWVVENRVDGKLHDAGESPLKWARVEYIRWSNDDDEVDDDSVLFQRAFSYVNGVLCRKLEMTDAGYDVQWHYFPNGEVYKVEVRHLDDMDTLSPNDAEIAEVNEEPIEDECLMRLISV